MADVFRYDLANGDSYIGERISVAGDVIAMRNYSAWYEGASAPYSSQLDDEVSFRVDEHTRVEKF